MVKEELAGTVNGDQATLRYHRKNFLVQLNVNIPYPKDFEYREEASSIGTAINRAIVKMRKELKGKRITEVRVKATKL